jgi:hypothetical protein
MIRSTRLHDIHPGWPWLKLQQPTVWKVVTLCISANKKSGYVFDVVLDFKKADESLKRLKLEASAQMSYLFQDSWIYCIIWFIPLIVRLRRCWNYEH